MILIVVANPEEAQPFIKELQLELASSVPFLTYANTKIAVVISNIGKVNAAGATSYGIAKFAPDVIYNIGLAASLHHDLQYSDIVAIKSAFQCDVYLPFTDQKYSYFASGVGLATDISRYKAGVLATGDSFVDDPEISRILSKSFHLADMEGYAVARIAQLNNIPCHMYKVIFDHAAESAQKDFFDTLEQMSYHRISELVDNLFLVLNKV